MASTADFAPDFSVVVPVFNEADNVRPLWDRLLPVLTQTGGRFEVVFVDDGSRDGTFAAVKQLHARASACVESLVLELRPPDRPAGRVAAGERRIVITMDGDLQHPPELIPKLIAKQCEGYDIVNTLRLDAGDTGAFKRISSRLFYRIMKHISDVPVEPAAADYRLMTRPTVDAFVSIPERDRFTRGLVRWMGFRQALVEYRAEPRASGRSKYTLGRMIRFGLDGITSFSSRPLRLSLYGGTAIAGSGLLDAVYAIFNFMRGRTIQGWTSILLTLLVIGGAILISLGIVGEYVGRIFNEVKARPLYFVRDATGLPEEERRR
jgi:dolichol-phosphate mannosyltransferase